MQYKEQILERLNEIEKFLLLPKNNVDRVKKLIEGDEQKLIAAYNWIFLLLDEAYRNVVTIYNICSPELWEALRRVAGTTTREWCVLNYAKKVLTEKWIETNPFKRKKKKHDDSETETVTGELSHSREVSDVPSS